MMDKGQAIVVGGGVAGATTAALLAKLGMAVTIIDQRPLKPIEDKRHRVVALGVGAQRIFQHLGLWDALDRDQVAAYRSMHVEAKGQSLDFQADAHGLRDLGFIVGIGALEQLLYQHISDHPAIKVHAPTSWCDLNPTHRSVKLTLTDAHDNVSAQLTGDVLVGADGAHSRVAERIGIEQTRWDYNQSALVGPVVTENPNPGIAWQRFTDLGPLALLPLPDGRSSIVWSLPRAWAEKAQGWSAEQWVTAINEHLSESVDDPMGAIVSIQSPGCWPLMRQRARTMHQGRVALVGDAAHAVHPLAGQGLNLGLLDAAALAQCIDQAPVADGHKDWVQALAHYGRWRLSATTVSALGIHAINELGHLPMGAGQWALGAAFLLTQKLWPVKQALIERAGGIDADAPLICQQRNH